MIKPPEDISIDDAHQWFGRGYFLVKEKEGWKVGRAPDLEVNEENDEITVSYRQTNGRRKSTDINNIRAAWPLCGAFNYNGEALYADRSTRRQWCRTLRDSGVRIIDVCKGMSLDLGPEIAEAMFFPSYPDSLGAAVEELAEGGRVSIAVNRCITLSINCGAVVVYHRKDAVGTLDRETLELGRDDVAIPKTRIDRLLRVVE